MTTHYSSSTPQSLFSPSFTTHSSSHRIEDIAARVIRELSNERKSDAEMDFNPICEEFWAENAELDSQQSRFHEELQSDGLIEEKEDSFQEELQSDGLIEEKEDDGEEEFEFPLIGKDWISCPVSKYPVFNTDLLLEAELIMDRNYKEEEKRPVPEKVIRLPLRMLFEEERQKSESEELNGIPVGTYCVWKPKKVEEGRRRWNNKSGLSKRWKWPELIHRISSDVGKGRFVFLAPGNGEDKKEKKVEEKVEKSKMAAVSPEKLAEHGRDKRRWIWSGSFSKANGMSWS